MDLNLVVCPVEENATVAQNAEVFSNESLPHVQLVPVSLVVTPNPHWAVKYDLAVQKSDEKHV